MREDSPSNPHKAASPGYLSHLHLQRAPFAQEPADGFYYAGPKLEHCLDLLTHLAQFSDLVLVVTAPAGGGKTSLLRQFLGGSGEAWRLCPMSARDAPHRNALLARLAACFGLNGVRESEGATEVDPEAVAQRCAGLRQAGLNPVVVVDDAHQLNGSTLHTLLTLGGDPAGTASRVHLVLVGEPSLVEALRAQGLDPASDRLAHVMELPLFDEEQTSAYLAYRLGVAGYSGESPFKPADVRAIHRNAGGMPGRINQLAHEMLEERMGQPAQRTGRESRTDAGRGRRWVLPVLAGVLGVAAAALVFWRQAPSGHTPSGHETRRLALPPDLASKVPGGGSDDSPLLKPLPPEKVPGKPAGTPSAAPPPANGTAPSGPANASAAPSPSPADAPADTASRTSAPAPAHSDTPTRSDGDAATHQPDAAAGAAPAGTGGSQSGSAAPAPAATSEPAPHPAPTPATAKSASSAPGPASPATGSPDRGTAAAQPPHRHGRADDWLLQQDSKAYTVQLLGAHSEGAVRHYIRSHHLGKDAVYYRGEFKGRPWYVVLDGIYPTIQAARKAAAALPAAVRKSGPWPRSLGSVQKDIRQARRAGH